MRTQDTLLCTKLPPPPPADPTGGGGARRGSTGGGGGTGAMLIEVVFASICGSMTEVTWQPSNSQSSHREASYFYFKTSGPGR